MPSTKMKLVVKKSKKVKDTVPKTKKDKVVKEKKDKVVKEKKDKVVKEKKDKVVKEKKDKVVKEKKVINPNELILPESRVKNILFQKILYSDILGAVEEISKQDPLCVDKLEHKGFVSRMIDEHKSDCFDLFLKLKVGKKGSNGKEDSHLYAVYTESMEIAKMDDSDTFDLDLFNAQFASDFKYIDMDKETLIAFILKKKTRFNGKAKHTITAFLEAVLRQVSENCVKNTIASGRSQIKLENVLSGGFELYPLIESLPSVRKLNAYVNNKKELQTSELLEQSILDRLKPMKADYIKCLELAVKTDPSVKPILDSLQEEKQPVKHTKDIKETLFEKYHECNATDEKKYQFEGYVDKMCKSTLCQLDSNVKLSKSEAFKYFCTQLIFDMLFKLGHMINLEVCSRKIKTINETIAMSVIQQMHAAHGLSDKNTLDFIATH
jgi:hypothetical protein